MKINDTEMKAYSREVKSFPWVLWLNITIRRNWFTNLWYTRGSNFFEAQVWIFKISIGMPWIKDVLVGKIRDYGSLKTAKETNEGILKNTKSIQIGNYEVRTKH